MNTWLLVGLIFLAIGLVLTLLLSFLKRKMYWHPLRYACALVSVDAAVYTMSKIGHYYGDEHPVLICLYFFAVLIITIALVAIFLPLEDDDNDWMTY